MDMNPIRTGEVYSISERVRRLTAPNPSVMTGPGTNAYLIGTDAIALIDPGPDIGEHIDALRTLVGAKLRWILCTHTHVDHSPAAKALKEATGAQVLGMSPPGDGRQDLTFKPDRVLRDGDRLQGPDFTLRVLHTPGHASNHLCYFLEEERLLFTGDHVMQGSTVVITPPDGDMVAYLGALEKLLAIDIARFAPGHGHVIETPHEEVRRLIKHRLGRESKVVAALGKAGRGDLDRLVVLAYDDVSEKLHPVARRSLLAHLLKLKHDGRVRQDGDEWVSAG
jgi:glyoxylase-like metal-dependent hydrolase (beta-lactamase superfamily II)